jgi:hypothetical protein
MTVPIITLSATPLIWLKFIEIMKSCSGPFGSLKFQRSCDRAQIGWVKLLVGPTQRGGVGGNEVRGLLYWDTVHGKP